MEKIQEINLRVKAMDYVRALAIIFMVFTHTLNILLGPEIYDSYPIAYIEDTIGSWAAPMFLLIVGMSLIFLIEHRQSKGENNTVHILIRGLFIIIVGFTLNILWNLKTFAFLDIFLIDILVLIGLSIIIIYFLFKYIPIWAKIIILFVTFALTPIFQEIFLYSGPYAYQEYPEDFGGVIANYLTNGLFPIFPYITYVMLGAILGEILFKIKKEQNSEKETQYLTFLLVIGIPLAILGFLFDNIDFLWSIFKWEDIFILTYYGMALIFLGIFMLLKKITPENRDYLKPLSEVSVISLTVYVCDQLYGIIVENFNLYPYLPIIFAFLVATIGTISVFILTHIWLRKFKYGPLEWILRKIS